MEINRIFQSEEQYHRFWYDLYNNSLRACNPVSPCVMKHYTQIPVRLIVKFSGKRKKSRSGGSLSSVQQESKHVVLT